MRSLVAVLLLMVKILHDLTDQGILVVWCTCRVMQDVCRPSLRGGGLVNGACREVDGCAAGFASGCDLVLAFFSSVGSGCVRVQASGRSE